MVMQARLLSRVQVAPMAYYFTNKDLYYIKTTPFLGWFFLYLCSMEKNIKYLGLELSLKLSSRNYSRQSLYSKEASSELMKDLMKVMAR
jgi:hypothetical protein